VARPAQEESFSHSWGEIVSSVSGLLRRLLGENIDLQTDLGSRELRIAMPPGPLRQIVINLLLNARDAMPGGGRILLTSSQCHECQQSCVSLTVEDEGCGMDEETRKHAFDAFFTTKPAGQGTGLGLATIRRVVDEYGGSIELETAPRRGTSVRIHLPQ